MDSTVDISDLEFWVEELKGTWFGDANLDGEFNSGDLVAVFEAGEYEDGDNDNSTWIEGDWNGDAEFTSSDLVFAFQDGGYEKGPRAATHAVPEPASGLVSLLGIYLLFRSSILADGRTTVR